MLKIENLKKSYDSFEALKGISFEAKKGEILALLGPNGAGKTTTMKIITGFLSASSGEVNLGDLDINNDTQEIQRKLGYLPENAPLYSDLNVVEHLELAAETHGITGKEKNAAIKKVLKEVSLEDRKYFQISELSKGLKQRVALAQALIHNPDILILDEPTTGLDPNQILEIRNLIKNLGQKKTIILSTHIMQEVEAIADNVVVIHKGEIVAKGTPGELMSGGEASHKVQVIVKGGQKEIISALKKVESVEAVEKQEVLDRSVTKFLVLASFDVRAEIAEALVKGGFGLLEMTTEVQSLEEVFYQITK